MVNNSNKACVSQRDLHALFIKMAIYRKSSIILAIINTKIIVVMIDKTNLIMSRFKNREILNFLLEIKP